MYNSYCLLWSLTFAANGITKYVTSPDDDVFVSLSKTYSYKHNNMFYGNHCGDVFPDGITNGALWYPVTGIEYGWKQNLELGLLYFIPLLLKY